MKRRTLHAAHPFGHINVTPLIDVVMVMIVFYLIVGKLAADRLSPVELPESRAGSDAAAPEVLVVNVVPGPDGATSPAIVVEQTPVGPESLAAIIRERAGQDPETAVLVRASRDLPYGAVAPVLQACREAGVASVRLAAERAP